MGKKLYPTPKAGQPDYLNHLERAVAEHGDSMAQLKERYARLCSIRDAANQAIEPFRQQLEALNAQLQALQAEANALAGKVHAGRGGSENWLTLKREIGSLARLLGGR